MQCVRIGALSYRDGPALDFMKYGIAAVEKEHFAFESSCVKNVNIWHLQRHWIACRPKGTEAK